MVHSIRIYTWAMLASIMTTCDGCARLLLEFQSQPPLGLRIITTDARSGMGR